MTDSPNDYMFALNVKQDSVVSHSKPVGIILIGQPLDVTLQPGGEPLDLSKNLIANSSRQGVQISYRGLYSTRKRVVLMWETLHSQITLYSESTSSSENATR